MIRIIKKIRLISLFLILLGVGRLSAQQTPQFSMYMFNPLALNPAYAGTKDVLSVTALHRTQWMNFEGAPTTQTLSFHSPIRGKHIGLGLSVVNDKIGSTNNTSLTGDFSYKIKLNRKKDYLSFGLKGGIDLYQADFSDRNVQDASDEVYLTTINNKMTPNFGFGIYYYGKKHYLGVTVPKLLTNELNESSTNTKSIQSRHYYLIGGYVFKLNSVLNFKPSFLVKYTPNAPLSADLNASFLIYNELWLGAMYRLNESIGINAIFYINNYLKIGYAYDYGITELNKYSSGSHEIMLGFELNKSNKKYHSPRYF